MYDPHSEGPSGRSSLRQVSGQVEADTKEEAEAKARAAYEEEYGEAPDQLVITLGPALRQ